MSTWIQKLEIIIYNILVYIVLSFQAGSKFRYVFDL